MTRPSPAARVVAELSARRLTVATAESLTGGRVAAELTSVPGASACFLGGVVSYATEVKVGVLGVPEDLVQRHGVVSQECAAAMASGVRRLLGADIGISTTGVAGPDLQEGKPVGTVYLGTADAQGAGASKVWLPGDRSGIQSASVGAAVSALAAMIGLDVEAAGSSDTRD